MYGATLTISLQAAGNNGRQRPDLSCLPVRRRRTMKKHTHDFVESYDGFIGFGYDRPTDEHTVCCYLQKLSDDRLMQTLLPRLSDPDLEKVFSFVSALLKKHLSEAEYHRLFLKDDHHA